MKLPFWRRSGAPAATDRPAEAEAPEPLFPALVTVIEERSRLADLYDRAPDRAPPPKLPDPVLWAELVEPEPVAPARPAASVPGSTALEAEFADLVEWSDSPVVPVPAPDIVVQPPAVQAVPVVPVSAAPAAPPIVIAGITLSPAQYRWLFDDLRVNIAADALDMALFHYIHHGKREITEGQRDVPPARLEAVALQRRLADHDATPCFELVTAGPMLLICFGAIPSPETYRSASAAPNLMQSRLSLPLSDFSGSDGSGGIAGIGSADQVAEWLREVVLRRGPNYLRLVGVGQGAVDAIRFGAMLVDRVVPEMSVVALAPPVLEVSALQALGGSVDVVLSAWDLALAGQLACCAEAGVTPLLVPSFEVAAAIDWAELDVPPMPNASPAFALVPLPVALKDAFLAEAEEAGAQLAQGAYDAAADELVPLLASHPRDPALLLHVGLLQALVSDEWDAAERLIKQGLEAIRTIWLPTEVVGMMPGVAAAVSAGASMLLSRLPADLDPAMRARLAALLRSRQAA
jgi:hypothetical protein